MGSRFEPQKIGECSHKSSSLKRHVKEIKQRTVEIAGVMLESMDMRQLMKVLSDPSTHSTPRPSLTGQFMQPAPSASDRWRKARGKVSSIMDPGLQDPQNSAPVIQGETITAPSLTQPVSKITVLGLGSLTSCSSERYEYRLRQLALSIALSKAVHQLFNQQNDMTPTAHNGPSSGDGTNAAASWLSAVEYCDPDFTQVDVDLILELGGNVMPTGSPSAQSVGNESDTWTVQTEGDNSPFAEQQGAPTGIALPPISLLQPPMLQPAWLTTEDSSPATRTLFYMPCCTRQLYGHVLTTHLQARTLQKISVLGTSFSSLVVSLYIYDLWHRSWCYNPHGLMTS
jgi:hypothetical protein